MVLTWARPDFLVKASFRILATLSIVQLFKLWVTCEEEWTTLQPEFRGADPPPSFIKQLWRIYELMPFPLSKEPEQVLEIEYANRIDLGIGRFLFPLDLQDEPTKVFWPEQYVKSYYTLVMTDLDWPSQRDRALAEYLHWMMVNIKGPVDNRTNETMAQYIGPKPKQGTGLHRYMYYLFKQPKMMEFHQEPKLDKTANDSRRLRFSIRKFSNKYNLGEPVAVTFWLGQFWHYNCSLTGTF